MLASDPACRNFWTIESTVDPGPDEEEALELSWSLTDEEKKIILDEHNKYRSQVSPPAMDMLKMSWDTELEAFAQAYAEKCIWDHNKERGRRGENLFAMAPTLDLEFAVEDWNGEEKYYNLTTSMCVPGQMCGHYTQVVWASTHQIGCGAKFCEKIEGIETEDMYLLVCNYYPPGNMKGRKPYKEGPSCSQCPEGRVCVNSLCEPTVEETTPAPVTTKQVPRTLKNWRQTQTRQAWISPRLEPPVPAWGFHSSSYPVSSWWAFCFEWSFPAVPAPVTKAFFSIGCSTTLVGLGDTMVNSG
ncbi:peptidase inhibitor 16 isoform X4 [Aquila chrysaetos chrysaetos]|uniref:peptidase inhibitor 16 isoform X4 n=1 Tax=Aquila chrysaetos chrysaetos TaxID=223781 RepID=UPI001B7D366E|nr:peptidase inhibitor 16 isoform X4 [Aquila chrysaetos chrysaetos]